MLEYTVEHYEERGKFGVCINNYAIVEIHYSMDRVASPVSKEKAEELANTIKGMVESMYPASELDEEEYKPSIVKMIDKLGDDLEPSDFFKLMLLKGLMD